MISSLQLENRLFDYFNTIFGSDNINFGFGVAASSCYIADRQSDAPRPAQNTLLFYRIMPVLPFGNKISSDKVYIDNSTLEEKIDTYRDIHVVVNILSKTKGYAIDAANWLISVGQSSRHNAACYSGSFDLVPYKIGEVRNLTELENKAWTERIEIDYYFNYNDTIVLNLQYVVSQPSSIGNTIDIVDYDLEVNK